MDRTRQANPSLEEQYFDRSIQTLMFHIVVPSWTKSELNCLGVSGEQSAKQASRELEGMNPCQRESTPRGIQTDSAYAESVCSRKTVRHLSIPHCGLSDHSVCPYGSVFLHLRREDRLRDPESKDSEEWLPIRPLESSVSTADSRAVRFGRAFDHKAADDQEAECRVERV